MSKSDSALPSAAPLDLDALERAPMVHDLKCWPDPFEAMLDGSKPYEIRRADRDYRVGDTLWLREWNPCDDYTGPNDGVRKLIMPHGYSGREVRREITYITEGGEWGLPADLCVLGLSPDAALVAAARRGEEDTARLDAISVPGAQTRVAMRALENRADPPMQRFALATIPDGPHGAHSCDRRTLREAIDAARPRAAHPEEPK